jgi:hypothetical protein
VCKDARSGFKNRKNNKLYKCGKSHPSKGTSMTKEALKLALEALEVANSCVDGYYIPKGKTHLPEIELAITAIKEALANEALEKMAENARELGLDYEPEQEPVGEIVDAIEGAFKCSFTKMLPVGTKLYTTPPQRTWVGLTDEEILSISADCASSHQHMDIHFARAIEAKLRSKNS